MIYGTTIYIGSFPLETMHGTFNAITYQDLIHKGYIIALCHGNIRAKILTTRIHSSCVTSETLCSMDCDCVYQLNGAIKEISMSDGILFYLIQEGRGCGYVGKSRGCMMVQSSEQKDKTPLTTFDVYKKMGMKYDYRNYSNIGDICKMLNISPEWILLSNNPDKIRGLKSINHIIKEIKSLEFTPNPFNYTYLLSKKKSGHLLYKIKKKQGKKYKPPRKVKIFKPHNLKKYKRFIYVASYYLPIRPYKNRILVTLKQKEKIEKKISNLVTIKLNDNLFLINDKIFNKNIKKFKSIQYNPYWFRVYVYYDIISHLDFVVLKFDFGEKKIPYVRIHSESIFNRFPLKNPKYRYKYLDAISKIVEYGHGYLFLMYHDGRGASLGNLCLNLNGNNGIKDKRNYTPVFQLLTHHIPSKEIHLLHSGSSKNKIETELKNNDISVKSWIYVGNCTLVSRLNNLNKYLNIKVNKTNGWWEETKECIITGYGSSYAHSEYLGWLLNRFTHIKACVKYPEEITDRNKSLIVISQGLSPNIRKVMKKHTNKNILLFSAVGLDKKEIYKKYKIHIKYIVKTSPSNEYQTLIRIEGPFAVYNYIYTWMKNKFKIEESISFNPFNHIIPDNIIQYIQNKESSLCLIVPTYLKKMTSNLQNKWIEGLFRKPFIVEDVYSFCHGTYQYLRSCSYPIVFVVNLTNYKSMFENNDNIVYNKLYEMLNTGNPITYWKINIKYDPQFIIPFLEYIFSKLVVNIINSDNINQIDWPGKNTQHIIYNIS